MGQGKGDKMLYTHW